jgi:stage IV sporulation protein FB
LDNFRTEISISPLFFALFAWLLIYEQKGLAAGCLAASLIHECGHLLIMLWRKNPPTRIVVGIFGMRMEKREKLALSFADDMWIAAGGPLLNILCFFLFWLCGKEQAAAIHLVIGGMNLLPIETLDGGEILLNVLYRYFSREKSQKLLLFCSVGTLFPLATVGFFILLQSGSNISLLAVTAYLILLLIFRRKR